jgi:hypothetical protein
MTMSETEDVTEKLDALLLGIACADTIRGLRADLSTAPAPAPAPAPAVAAAAKEGR